MWSRYFGAVMAIVVSAAGLAVVGSVVQPAAASQTGTPSQFIVKTYTEALGRPPTASDMSFWETYFSNEGCTESSLVSFGTAVYTGPASQALNYAGPARIVSLWRGALNDEPSQNNLGFFAAALDQSVLSWEQVVDLVYASAVFDTIAEAACDSESPDYGFGATSPSDPYYDGQGASSRSQAALQGLLDASCGTVELQPSERVLVDPNDPLVVPACVTLRTAGSPELSHYAAMGRLVADSTPCSASAAFCDTGTVVLVEDGGTLEGVWVSAAGVDGTHLRLATVGVQSGSVLTSVTGSRISDPAKGGVGIRLDGWSTTGIGCSNRIVDGVLVSAYARSDDQLPDGGPLWADGIVVQCEGAALTGSKVVDVPGYGISLHGSWNSQVGNATPFVDARRIQASSINGNEVIAAGSSAVAAFEVVSRVIVSCSGLGWA